MLSECMTDVIFKESVTRKLVQRSNDYRFKSDPTMFLDLLLSEAYVLHNITKYVM